MKLKKIGLIILALLCFLAPGLETQAYYIENAENITYIYDMNGMAVKTLDAYSYEGTIDLRSIGGLDVTDPVDMCVKGNGEVFILEGTLGAIIHLDSQLNYEGCLQEFVLPDGSATTLNGPQGIYVSETDTLYVADTNNERILVSDLNGNVSLVVVKPENLLVTNLSTFLPSKVVADTSGRISVVATNINSGIMQFTRDGVFSGYVGAPSVTVDAFTKLIRKLYSAEKRASMTTYVPTEYNNVKIDGDNFIWGTISALALDDVTSTISSRDLTGKVTPIKKLNMSGTDVLVRKDNFAPIGDLQFVTFPSKIIDVGVGPHKIYSLLDSTEGRIFTYNHDGILLYAFGGNGTEKGATQNPIAIDYVGDHILILDSGLRSIVMFEPTNYGGLLISAEGYYLDGEYDLANEAWRQVTEMDSTFTYPYVGLGNAEASQGKYSESLEYYEYANDRIAYSNSKEKMRKESMSVMFPYIAGAVVILMVVFVGKGIYVKVRRYVRGELTTYGEEDEA